jgi:hypothetical protein
MADRKLDDHIRPEVGHFGDNAFNPQTALNHFVISKIIILKEKKTFLVFSPEKKGWGKF